MINLYHRKNELAIDLSTIDNPRAISIAFSGVMYGESQLPNDRILMQGNNKIISITTQLNGKNSTVTIVGGA